MPKIVGYREVVHQPVMFDFGRGQVWGGSGGMFAGGSAGGGFVGGGQAPEGGMAIGGMGRAPRRGSSSWRRPQRGLGFLSRRTRSNMASGVMTSAVWMLGIPAAVGAGVAYLKRKDEDTITRWAIYGGLIGLAAQVAVAVAGVSLTGWLLSRATSDPWGTAGALTRTATGRAQEYVGLGRC